MVPPEFLTCQEAADHLGSLESLRQTILAHAFPAYLKLDSAMATSLDDVEDHLASGRTTFSAWERQEHWFDIQEMIADQGELTERHEPSDEARNGWDRAFSYTLTGWFLLSPTYAGHVAFDHPVAYRGAAHVAVSTSDESETSDKPEEPGATHWFDVGVNAALKDLWFRSTDIDLMASPTLTKVNNDAVSTREANSMLRIISALAVMAKLPERGGAASVEAQLIELGFDGPKEATVRRLLVEARENTPLKKGTKSPAITKP